MAGGPERTVKAAVVGEEANHPQLDEDHMSVM